VCGGHFVLSILILKLLHQVTLREIGKQTTPALEFAEMSMRIHRAGLLFSRSVHGAVAAADPEGRSSERALRGVGGIC
jgi:hypothetical protein